MIDLKKFEITEVLTPSHVGVLCLSHDNKAYGIPLFFKYERQAVYFHCHPGVKDEYLAGTAEACLVVTHVESSSIWESVQVFGKIEKLSLNTDIEAAKSALFNTPFPPAEGHTPSGKPSRTDQDVYYARLKPTRVSGKGSGFRE